MLLQQPLPPPTRIGVLFLQVLCAHALKRLTLPRDIEALQQDRPSGLISPAFYARGSASPFCTPCCHENYEWLNSHAWFQRLVNCLRVQLVYSSAPGPGGNASDIDSIDHRPVVNTYETDLTTSDDITMFGNIRWKLVFKASPKFVHDFSFVIA